MEYYHKLARLLVVEHFPKGVIVVSYQRWVYDEFFCKHALMKVAKKGYIYAERFW